MVGFVDLGADSLDNDAGEATEAVVVMAVGLQSQWKVPVAYFRINGISAEVQSQLVLSAIRSLYEAKVNVVALVMDGRLSANQKMANVMGCSLAVDDIRSSFPHPSDNARLVHVFFDGCHLLTRFRVALHALQEMISSVGTAKWKHMFLLQEL